MPFEFPAVPALNPDATPKYDLATGRGRLLYLADQLEARRPVGFTMAGWAYCAIAEARKLPALSAQGLDDVENEFDQLARFFKISEDQSISLFGALALRSLEQEVAALRLVANRPVRKRRY